MTGLFTAGSVVASDHKVFDVKELLCREQKQLILPNNIVFSFVVVTA